ncbi:hypothetical protein [Legionella gresilensis]|uniref:hypothetical protein n=1 Tax=Legionella gresilensis TaxID=91823 RepID=UPI0013EFB042|nr:hypothetical protein [Legionella gresilensis]
MSIDMVNAFLWGSASKVSNTEFARQLIIFLQAADQQSLRNLHTSCRVIEHFIHGYIQDMLKKQPSNSILLSLVSLNKKIQILQTVVQENTFAEVQQLISNYGSNKAYENFFKHDLPDILTKGGRIEEIKVGLLDFQSKMENDSAAARMSNSPIGNASAVIRRLEDMIDRLERTNIFEKAFAVLTGRAELTSRKISALTALRDRLKEQENSLNQNTSLLEEQFEEGLYYQEDKSRTNFVPLKELLQLQRFSFFDKKTTSTKEIEDIENIIKPKT